MDDLGEKPEKSLVTVLVVDTVGSTKHISELDPDDAQIFLDEILNHIRAKIEAFGGMLVSYAGDGGVAIFGWPKSLEEHADSACEAAWAIQNERPEIDRADHIGLSNIQFRIGVHSGLVGMRKLNLQVGPMLDLVGPTVHFAAQLEKCAPPGQTIISAITRGLCQGELELAPFRELPEPRGWESEVFRLRAPPSRDQSPGARARHRFGIVGRNRELAALEQVCSRKTPQERAVVLIGEPGIGKSRIAAAACEEAKDRIAGLLVLDYASQRQKWTTPYEAMRALIFELLQVTEPSDGKHVDRALSRSGLSREQREIVELALTGASRLTGSELDVHGRQLARSLVDILGHLTSGRQILLLIEDLHWLDPESRYCLGLIVEADWPNLVMLMATARPETPEDALEFANTVMQVEPLSPADIRQLARQLWTSGSPTGPQLKGIVERADGIPFVLEQIVLSMNASGTKKIARLPNGVKSLIHARLNRLEPNAKSLAQSLSILGDDISFDFARAALALDEAQFTSCVAELERHAIIRVRSENKIGFHHAIIADACVRTVPRPWRKALHAAATRTIHLKYADLDAHYEHLAFHAEGAGDDHQAVEYLWKAGLNARRKSASASLQLVFENAIRCLDRIGPDADRRFVDFVLMAFAELIQRGEFIRMKPYLMRSIRLAREQGRTEKLCGAMCHWGMICWYEGRFKEGLENTEAALKTAKELNSTPLIFSAQFMLACLNHGMGATKLAIERMLELLELFAGSESAARFGANGIPYTMIHSFAGWFMTDIGKYTDGLEHSERGLEIATIHSHPYSEMIARLGMGKNLLMLHRNDEAARNLKISRDIAVRDGYETVMPHVLGLLSAAWARNGMAADGVHLIESQLSEDFISRTGRFEYYYLLAGYAEALFRNGDPKKAREIIDEAIALARQIDAPNILVQGLCLRSGMQTSLGSRVQSTDADAVEIEQLCKTYGFVAWQPRDLLKHATRRTQLKEQMRSSSNGHDRTWH